MNRKTLIYYVMLSCCSVLFAAAPLVAGAETLSNQLGLPVKTIMIDPWYGGKESGPLFAQKRSKEITLDIARNLQKLLVTDGFKVFLTRNDDQLVPLENRLFQAKEKGVDVHIALKVSRAKQDCLRVYAPYASVKEVPLSQQEGKPENLDAQLDDILKNLKAQSISLNSISLAGRISNRFKNANLSDCVEVWRGEGYYFTNAQLPTVMVDIRSTSTTSQRPNMLSEKYLADIVRMIGEALIEYSDDISPRAL